MTKQYKKFTISRPEKYTDNQGQEKTAWRSVGMATIFLDTQTGKESGMLQLNMFSDEYLIFPLEPRQQQQQGGYQQNGNNGYANAGVAQATAYAPRQQQQPQQRPVVEYPDDAAVNPEDIPF